MAIPAPNLDDRRFQDLVDEAKRGLQRRWPEWTGWSDHNVSDPGVTLIETTAYLVEQLLFRLNRVPERLYARFLDLIGLRLHPPSAARAAVTFFLTSAPRDHSVVVPTGSVVATERTIGAPAVSFRTVEPLDIRPCSRMALGRQLVSGNGQFEMLTSRLDERGEPISCFAAAPRPGDAFYIGLSEAVGSLAVAVDITAPGGHRVSGVGVNPRLPPWEWHAYTGAATSDGWESCRVEPDSDDTWAFTKTGKVTVHVPTGHRTSELGGVVAGWLRCRVAAPRAGFPPYEQSPLLESVTAYTVGGTVAAEHSELAPDEVLGLSEGGPGQRFELQHRPLVAHSQRLEVDVAGESWEEVGDFGRSGPDDRHVVVDRVEGAILFGPTVWEPDGTLRHCGAVPAQGAAVVVRGYRYGGGRVGNLRPGQLRVVESSIPHVRTDVRQFEPAWGGSDPETIEAAKAWAPIELLRVRDRAVTPDDYEYLARRAAPELARVACLPVSTSNNGEWARVVLVPDTPAVALTFDELGGFLSAPDDVIERVRAYLDARRTIGARLVVDRPVWTGVRVRGRLRVTPRSDPAVVAGRVHEAVGRLLHPVVGGGGDGWPLGQAVEAAAVRRAVQAVGGVDVTEEVELVALDLARLGRADYPPVEIEGHQRLNLPPHGLPLYVDHRIDVRSAA